MALTANSAIPPVSEADLAGFSAFFDSLLAQSGGTVMKPGGKAGDLHTDGPFKGMTSEQGRAEAMRLWSSMPPNQRAMYAPRTATPAAAPATAAQPGAAPATQASPVAMAAPQQAFAPPPKGFSGLEALYQMNPQLRRTAPPPIAAAPSASPSPSLPVSASSPPPPLALPKGVAQQSSTEIRYDTGAGIYGQSGGPRVLAAPTGSGSATPIAPGQARPPAIFTNMETGQPQSLAQATGGRAVLPAPTAPAPGPARMVTGTATAGGERAITTPSPQASVGKPAGAMAITPTSLPNAAGNVASASAGVALPARPAPPTSVASHVGPARPTVLAPPPGKPPRMMTPIQQGAEAVSMGAQKAITTAGATAANTATQAARSVANVADKAKQAVMWPVTPRPVR